MTYLWHPASNGLKRALKNEINGPNQHVASGCRYADAQDLQFKVIQDFQDSYETQDTRIASQRKLQDHGQ